MNSINIDKYRNALSILLQNNLLNETAFIRFAKQRGIEVSGVVSGDPSNFCQRGWLESDNSISEKLKFHPFRIYPLFKIIENCKLNISPSSTINREKFPEFISRVLNYLQPLEEIEKETKIFNEIANLAILLEPIYWPKITSLIKHRSKSNIEKFDKLIDDYKIEVLPLLEKQNPDIWRNHHKRMRMDSAQMDDNGNLYILLRCSPWLKREKCKGQISAALWFRHIAEVIRRGFEEVHRVNWPEEDQAYGHWYEGLRKKVYGSEKPIDNILKTAKHISFEFGLITGSTVRWYLEGETEYHAAKYLLPSAAVAGIELINLKGALGKEKANIALRLADCLTQDLVLSRFSFITFDMDVHANVKVIRQQVIKGRIIGHVNGNDPDFEFGNFSLCELIELAAKIDDNNDFNGDYIRNGDWNGISSSRDFENKYKTLSERKRNLKGEEWGRALAELAISEPYKPGSEKKRPIIETMEMILRGCHKINTTKKV